MRRTSQATVAQDRARISEIVRGLRRERGLSQAQLASDLGLSQNRLSEIERGGGSFTAEQFLAILRLFNVPLSRFYATPSARDSLQKVLARLGAGHSIENPDVLPSERLRDVDEAVREALLDGSPRLLTALAPVLVRNASSVNLSRIYRQLAEVGRDSRLLWVVDNTVHALAELLDRHTEPTTTTKLYREALPPLRAFRDVVAARTEPRDTDLGPDVLERLRSSRTLASVAESATPISKRWNIISRLRPQDFVQVLEDTFGIY